MPLAPTSEKAVSFPLDPETPPMEAHQTDALPDGRCWQFEPKWDGFRCLVFRSSNLIEMRAKSGKSLARFFPEVVAMLNSLKAREFVLDGELVVNVDGASNFDFLQMRLHPAASRIARLAKETPATLILFDYLAGPAGSWLDAPLSERRRELEAFYNLNAHSHLKLSPFTLSRATALGWLDASGGAIDGVVAKRLDRPYRPGQRSMIKVKRLRTADCVVGGFRYLERERLAGSLLLGLYNRKGELDHVGFTSAISASHRAALTKELEQLVEPPGFTGKAPGGPSRWTTEKSTEWVPLRPVLVAEVQYDHVSGCRFRHGTKFLRWRPDKAPHQCTLEQLSSAGPASADLLGREVNSRPSSARR
ncbi:MAG: ATP-dependent DNA ligase [Rhodomicrobium sp.]